MQDAINRLYERVKMLAEEKGVSVHQSLIANELGVTLEELLEEKKPVVKSERLEKFIRLFESLTPEQQATFISQMEWIADKKD